MPADADFYALELLLDTEDRALLHRVRAFMEKEVEPIINRYWTRAKFPHEILPGLRELGIAGLPYAGYGCPGKSPLLDGMVAMELARTDPSIATFNGVHGGLAMGSIYLCGSEEQKRRWLPAMARMEQLGAFGLTEPEVGSGAARGLATAARRDGDGWVLEGRKKWIGNASFADLTVIWARDVTDGQVKGFVVEAGTPGFTTENLEDKIALRVVQNALITLDGVRVPEANRLQEAASFRDTAEVLRMTRAGVAWMAVGCAAAPTSTPWPTPPSASSSAGPSAASSWSRTCWSGCWATSRRRRPCACGWPSSRTPAWPGRSAPCGCARRWAGPGSCWAATASCSSTTSAASSPTPRRSTPTRAPGR
jgi:alkylation response protein AidB-like acyl-CoA dehydrogenase